MSESFSKGEKYFFSVLIFAMLLCLLGLEFLAKKTDIFSISDMASVIVCVNFIAFIVIKLLRQSLYKGLGIYLLATQFALVFVCGLCFSFKFVEFFLYGPTEFRTLLNKEMFGAFAGIGCCIIQMCLMLESVPVSYHLKKMLKNRV